MVAMFCLSGGQGKIKQIRCLGKCIRTSTWVCTGTEELNTGITIMLSANFAWLCEWDWLKWSGSYIYYAMYLRMPPYRTLKCMCCTPTSTYSQPGMSGLAQILVTGVQLGYIQVHYWLSTKKQNKRTWVQCCLLNSRSPCIRIQRYHIAGNFRGRKLSRIGRKGAFRRENFRGMLNWSHKIGVACLNFHGENFHGWL